ncbi:TPA: P-loop NTPase fold protein [Yersinia enterocolitica]
MPFDWSSASSSGYPSDRLDRAKYAEFLTNFLVEKGKNENYVLNLNAQWGAGKTWFLRRWAEEIEVNHPVILIDAWKDDHSKDPLLTVISAIQSGLQNKTDKNVFQSSFASKSWLLMKGVAPELAKGLIKKITGVDSGELLSAIEKDDVDSLASFGGEFVKNLVTINSQTSKAIDSFKTSISEWLDAVINQNKQLEYPLFIFIDELDRCRPTYAIEMLETIKHLFDMKKVIFIIATDKEQLQHSIKAVYGTEFNSRKYLDRFFDRSITLSKGDNRDYIYNTIKSSAVISEFINNKHNDWFVVGNDECVLDKYIELFSIISMDFNMDLRTIKQWLERLDATLSNSHELNIEVFYLAYLLAAYSCNDVVYKYISSQSLNYSTISFSEYNKVFFEDRKNDNRKISLYINAEVMGSVLIGRGNGNVTNPWGKTLVNITIGALYLSFEGYITNYSDNSYYNMINKIKVHDQSRRDNPSQIFEVEYLINVFNSFKHKNRMEKEKYIELVELAAVIE